MPQTRNGHALTQEQKRRYDSLTDRQKNAVDRSITDSKRTHVFDDSSATTLKKVRDIVGANIYANMTKNQRFEAARQLQRGVSPQNVRNYVNHQLKGVNVSSGTFINSIQESINNLSRQRARGLMDLKDKVEQSNSGGKNTYTEPIADKGVDKSTPLVKNESNSTNVSDKVIKNTPASSNKPSTHTIAAGETLGGIAKKYGVDWRQLAKDNGIDNPNLIIAGRKLNINGATKKPAKRKQRRYLSEQRPRPNISRQDVINQLAPIAAPSDNVAPAYRGATNPYTSPRQLWI